MVVLFLLAALLQEPVWSSLYGSRFLTGGVGGSITHQCFYSSTPANKHDRKYWCKITGNGVCYTIISSEHYTSGDYEGRVSLGDVPQNGTFSVTMTGLRSSDTGTYRCGIGTTNEGLFVSLNLTVLADAPVPRPTQLVRGDLHGSVTVLCPSGDTQAGEKRFWCKVGRSSCTLVASSDGYVSRSFQGRVLLTPRESSGAFKVLINDLKKEDSGLYLCGTQRLGGQHSPQEVVLQVTTASALPRRPKFLSGTVGGSLSFQCHHEPGGSYERKYLCRWKGGSCPVLLDDHGFVLEAYRGRIQMSRSDAARGAYTVLLRQLGEQDAGWYWCGAQSGHTEHTASVKLRVLQEICSSQDPETTTPVRFTSGPAAHGTPTQRSVPGLMGTATESTTVGTGTQDSSTLLPTATPGTSATSPGETFQERMTVSSSDSSLALVQMHQLLQHQPEPTWTKSTNPVLLSSSSGEPRLLPAVLPALVLLICIAVTALTLAKVKLRKKMGEGRRTTGNLETALDRAGLSPGKEETTEENPSPEEVQECRMGSGKCRKICAILGNTRMTNLYLPYWEKRLFKVTDEDLSQNLL